jgi:ABC-type ATPase involved in cell division
MSLLALEHVGKRYSRGRHEYVALRDVSLTVEPGEHVAIWGVSRSGRTTLLRIAAGLERPDEGVVRFGGRELVPGIGPCAQGVAFVQANALAGGGASVADDVAMPLLARGLTRRKARIRAARELDRVEVAACAGLAPADLRPSELMRATIAQALVTDPRLLIIDDPTRHVELLERESLLLLLRSISGGHTAVLMTTGEAIGVSGVDRALTISEGELRAEVSSQPSPVIPLRGSRAPV